MHLVLAHLLLAALLLELLLYQLLRVELWQRVVLGLRAECLTACGSAGCQ